MMFLFTGSKIPLFIVILQCFVMFVRGQNVYLSLGGTPLANNSVVVITDIGERANGAPPLVCTTTFRPCCASAANRHGEWFYPNGTMVPNSDIGWDFYRGRSDDGEVFLNKRNNNATMSPLGTYACELPLTSTTDQARLLVTVLEPGLPPPSSPTIVSTTSQSTSITITWTQPEGDDVDNYEITYSYLEPCPNAKLPVTMTTSHRSIREYTVMGLEEFSDYQITITAVNRRSGRSGDVRITARTLSAAPSGQPQSLALTTASNTSITIQWKPVECFDKNSDITHYRVRYGLTSTTDRVPMTINANTRMFTATRLTPRMSYTFEVEALNIDYLFIGPTASITVRTPPLNHVGLLLNGVLYGNNSIVTLNEIGEGSAVLFCVTNNTDCCHESNTPPGVGSIGNWFYPNGRKVYFYDPNVYRGRGPSFVNLNHRNSTNVQTTGVYRCVIPDASGTNQQLYVGLYPVNSGSPSITGLVYNPSTLTLTCTSTGGPATTVTWRKNGAIVEVDGTTYHQSQRVVNTRTATYDNLLTSSDISTFIGSFTCTVNNSRGYSSISITLNGVRILRPDHPLTVGIVAIISCISDVPATRIEWLDSERRVVALVMSTDQLDLIFNPVNDSIHNSIYTCRVTREIGMAEDITTISVAVPPDTIEVNVATIRSTAVGQEHTLECQVSTLIPGLANTPTATWLYGDATPILPGDDGTIISPTAPSSTSTLSFTPGLTTSHAGVYICEGRIESPALDTPLIIKETQDIIVKIPPPSVMVTVQSMAGGTLYAGTTLSLTCTATVDDAVNTEVDVDIQWTPSSARLISQETIRSRAVFTSTATVSPLSMDTEVTCSALVRPQLETGFITESTAVSESVPLDIEPPPPPTVTISPSVGTPTAGDSLILTCIVTVIENLIQPPSVAWTGPGGHQLTDGVVEMVSDTVTTNITLSFNPLRTSHAGGQYTCTAVLDIPTAGVSTLINFSVFVLTVQIPQPSLNITLFPEDGQYFIGDDLIMTCTIELNDAVDTPVTVDSSWTKDGSPLMTDDSGRITVSDAETVSGSLPLQFRTRIMLVSLQDGDEGQYTCTANVSSLGSNRVTTTISQHITIPFHLIFRGVSYPNNSVLSLNDIGDSSTGSAILCTTNKSPCCSTTDPTMQLGEWCYPNGSLVPNNAAGEDFFRGREDDRSVRLNRRNNAQSPTGSFCCELPDQIHKFCVALVALTVFITPSTASPSFRSPYTLTCGVSINGADQLNPIITYQWFKDNTLVSDETQSTLSFSSLSLSNAGQYRCDVTVSSTLLSQSITEISNTQDLILKILPPTSVTATASRTGTIFAGSSLTLTCTILLRSTSTRNIEITVNTVWSGPSDGTKFTTNTPVATMMTATTYTSTAAISSVEAIDSGEYTCTATVTSTSNNPFVLASEALSTSTDVTVEPVITAIVSGGTPTVGESYSLTCTIHGADRLNFNPTVTYQWFYNDNTVVSDETQWLLSTLSFPSLSLSDAGQYRCDITVSSTLQSQNYANMSNTHNLILKIPPPRVTVTASPDNSIGTRGSSSLTLNCSIELSEAVDIAVTVNTVWSGPSDGTQFNSSATETSALTYTSTASFSSSMSSDSGAYTCRVTVSSSSSPFVHPSNETVGTKRVKDVLQRFQLKMRRTDDCITWNANKAKEIRSYIFAALLQAITSRCQCEVPIENLLNGVFSCLDSHDQTTYRSTIIGTQSHTATQLEGYLQDWVTSDPTLTIQWYSVKLDQECPVSISSLGEPECVRA